MDEEHLNRIAKKLRNKLIYFINSELQKKLKDNHLLINSLSTKELNDKYQNYSDYCIKTVETYSSSQMSNGFYSHNYYHVSITYNSFNNNYHMLIDNIEMGKMNGKHNIVGKYYKGNSVHIKTARDKTNYNIVKFKNENKLEKILIGNKKFKKKRKPILSSLEITKNISFIDKEKNDNNENNNYLNNINSNHNNYKKLMNINNDNKKVETIFENKFNKSKNQKIINLYTTKLIKYCSTLKILRKKRINICNQIKSPKLNEFPSPIMNDKKKNFRKGYSIRPGKDRPKMFFSIFSKRESKDYQKYKTENQNQSQSNNKLKSQTKINQNQNLSKMPEKKKILHKKIKIQNIDKIEEKFSSSKKPSPKKIYSPKKTINSVRANNSDKHGNIIFPKNNKKNKEDIDSIKKYISGGILSKRKLFSNNANFKNSNYNDVGNLKQNFGISKKPGNRNFKRANTIINKMYNFRK